ncbi:MAG: hypothetical protein H0V29_02455 [Thermoleophilaceae bacterium]|nr:hypothetical protein [Thermoleophilaceae bacterium]
MVKARKFRFGRTEKAIRDQWGLELIHGEWDPNAGANSYTMDTDVARALREKIISDE